MPDSMSMLAEIKLIIMLLIERMNVLMSNSEICQFLLENNISDYFKVQQYLSELEDAGLIEVFKDNNNIRYSVTDEGREILNYFINHVSEINKCKINSFVEKNRGRIKSELEVTANYFVEPNNEFLVKCAVCESDGTLLMELNLTVANKTQAKLICSNWKKHCDKIYGSVFAVLSAE